MKTSVVMGLAALAGATSLAVGAETVKFYGGDADGSHAGADSGSFAESWVYDDFGWDGSSVTSVFGNYVTPSADPIGASIVGANVQIRSGMSANDGGTSLINQTLGLGALTLTSIADPFGGGNDAFRVDVDIADAGLAAGTYHIAIQLLLNVDIQYFLAATDGDNSVGSPIGNGNSFFHSPNWFGYTYEPTGNLFGNTYDYSYGVNGAMIPLPTASAMAGIGLLGLGVRRRRVSL